MLMLSVSLSLIYFYFFSFLFCSVPVRCTQEMPRQDPGQMPRLRQGIPKHHRKLLLLLIFINVCVCVCLCVCAVDCWRFQMIHHHHTPPTFPPLFLVPSCCYDQSHTSPPERKTILFKCQPACRLS